MSDALDRLYQQLGHASAFEGTLAEQSPQLHAQIEARQQELEKQRAAAEAAGDSASVEQIDTEHAALDEAYKTLNEQDPGENQRANADRPGDQRPGDSDPAQPGR